MSLNVSSITAYSDDEAFGLGRQLVLNADDMKYFGYKIFNITGTVPLHRQSNSITGTGDYCPEGDSGTTTFTANVLTPCPLNFVQRDCARQLQEYWAGKFVAAEATGESFGDLQSAIMEDRMEQLDKVRGLNRWQGAKSSPAYASTTYTLCDGLFQVAYAGSATTAANVAKTAFTEANSVQVIKDIVSNIPAAVKQSGNAKLFVSPTNFDTILYGYLNSYGTATQISLGDPQSSGEFRIPMTLVTLVRMNYMDGIADGSAIATHPDNMAFGSRLETASANIFYDGASDKLIMRANFYEGQQFVNMEEVVIVK